MDEVTPDGIYQRDVLVWAERRAVLLRRLPTGERQVAMERERAGVIAPAVWPFGLNDVMAEKASIGAPVRRLIDEGHVPQLP